MPDNKEKNLTGKTIVKHGGRLYTCVILMLLGVTVAGASLQEEQRIHLPCTGGWKFFFAGDDTSLQYAQGPVAACSTVTLPHVFPQDQPDTLPPSGFGWYFRDIRVPDDPGRRELRLDFSGVCLFATVFVDGHRAANSAFAYLPFSVNLTPYTKDGQNLRVAVRVDNRLLPGRIPDDKARGWWVYGGIIREVTLSLLPKRRIGRILLQTMHHDSDTFDLRCRFTWNRAVPPPDSVRLFVGNQSNVPEEFTLFCADTTVRMAGIHPWTPEDPFLYQLRMVPYFGDAPGVVDTITRGFCQLATKGSELLLNGNPYYIRGMARHDVREPGGRQLTRAERRADLLAMKGMGCNFLRIAHFPQHSDIYELCDSIGLLVMDEIPAWKTAPQFLGSRAGREYGAAYLRDLLIAHGNYTCIGIWSVGNQFKSYKTSVADFVGFTAGTVRAADPSRLVTFCSYYYMWDKAFKSVDVISVNEYFGWELASLDMLGPMLDKIGKEWPEKPVLVTELGAQAKRGLRNPEPKLAGPISSMLGKDISEDHQALFIGAHMDTIRTRRHFVHGMSVWAYADYMADLKKRRTADMPFGINACGVVTAGRKRKLSWEAVEKRYCRWRDVPDNSGEEKLENGE
jgi:beta-glucuronidase